MNETSNPIVNDFDARLTPDERGLVARAKDFAARVVAPQARQWEYNRRHPTDALRLACREGLAAIELAPALGGHGLRFSATLRIVEELARHDFGFAFSLVNHHNAIARISRAGSATARRLVSLMLSGDMIGCSGYTEPDHGSDLAGLATSAAKVDGGWLLSGTKAWITNAAVADVIIVLTQTNRASGSQGLATFIVEASQAGFIREPAYALHAAHSIGLGGFSLENCFVPDDAVLEPAGAGFAASLAGINRARCYVAAMCAGMLDAAIEQAVGYASRRQAFGQPLIEFQGLRWRLVDADTDLAALRLLAYRAAGQIDAGQNAEEAAAHAKKFAGERTLGHIAGCIQAMGASGLRSDHPLMRHLAAAKTAAFADGTTEMMNERLGKLLVRRLANRPPGA